MLRAGRAVGDGEQLPRPSLDSTVVHSTMEWYLIVTVPWGIPLVPADPGLHPHIEDHVLLVAERGLVPGDGEPGQGRAGAIARRTACPSVGAPKATLLTPAARNAEARTAKPNFERVKRIELMGRIVKPPRGTIAPATSACNHRCN